MILVCIVYRLIFYSIRTLKLIINQNKSNHPKVSKKLGQLNLELFWLNDSIVLFFR